jgi:hypothetical protein
MVRPPRNLIEAHRFTTQVAKLFGDTRKGDAALEAVMWKLARLENEEQTEFTGVAADGRKVYREVTEGGRSRPAVVVLFSMTEETIEMHSVRLADDDE